IAAQEAGRFDDEIIPVGDLDADESPRRDTSPEKLASLKPVFDPEGTTTAGNAPGVNDGASCVVVASEEWARRRGIEPLATIVSQGYVADEYAYLARTPAKAAARALERAGKTIDDVERVEINEAFSSVARHSTRVLVVHRPRYDDWSLPKGKLKLGESWEAAALREVEEETGLRCELGELVGATCYGLKEVRYFRMQCDGEPCPQNEIDEVRWVPL